MSQLEPRPQDLHTEDLRVLLAVFRAGRMSAAGALLGIDHTTVRRRIDRLEATLNARLLERGNDGWELTAVGRAVVAHAGPLERIVEQVLGEAAVDSPEGGYSPRGRVQLLAPEGFAIGFVGRAVGRVRAQYPRITVDLATSSRSLGPQITGPQQAGFDIAITVGASTTLRVSSAPLADYSLRLYASQSYLSQHPPIETPDDLRAHGLTFYVDALLTMRDLDLAQVLGGMPQAFSSTNVFAQVEATRHGAGIGLLPDFLGGRAANLVPVLPDLVNFRLTFHMSTRSRIDVPDAVEIVRAALVREVQERATELLPYGP